MEAVLRGYRRLEARRALVHLRGLRLSIAAAFNKQGAVELKKFADQLLDISMGRDSIEPANISANRKAAAAAMRNAGASPL